MSSGGASTAAVEPPALRSLTGPRAMGGTVDRYRRLLWLTAVADFQRKYSGSHLGYGWTLLRPLLLFAVLYTVITQVFGRFASIPDYGVILLLNITLFQFFSEATSTAMTAFRTDSLARKMELPLSVIPLARVMTAGFSLLAGLAIVVVWALVSGVDPTWRWLLFPLIVAVLVALTAGTGLMTCALYVDHRDVEQIWPAISRALFYVTPLLFPIEFVPEGVLSDLQSLNPLAPIFAEARVLLVDPSAPGWFGSERGVLLELLPLALLIAIVVGGALAFRRAAKRAAQMS